MWPAEMHAQSYDTRDEGNKTEKRSMAVVMGLLSLRSRCCRWATAFPSSTGISAFQQACIGLADTTRLAGVAAFPLRTFNIVSTVVTAVIVFWVQAELWLDRGGVNAVFV